MSSAVGFRSERGPVLVAIMLATALVAIDATILATAVPTIVAEIGGPTQAPWLFSVYLLAQAVSTPIYGKLADQFGRMPVLLVGIGFFLVGSVACGVAWSMPALIAFRAVQGLGAGAIQPLAITVAGDVYSVTERPRVQAYIAAVWATSSVVGPALGGVFTQFVSWRWIFFVNVPLCLLTAWMLKRGLRETVEPRRHRVDYAGCALLTVGLAALLLATLEGGQGWAWDSAPSIVLLAGGVLVLAVFALVERRAAEPVMPGFLFRRRLLLGATAVALGVGAVLVGLTSYVPTFLQGAVGSSPLVSGLAVASLTLGWPLAASNAGRFYLRMGFRSTVVLGAVIALVGTVVLVVTAGSPGVAVTVLGCFVTGFGLGLCSTPSIIAAQSSVGWAERGVVTGTNVFARAVGSAAGAAVLGALANAAADGSVGGLVAGASRVYLGAAVCALLILGGALALPRRSAGRTREDAASPTPIAEDPPAA